MRRVALATCGKFPELPEDERLLVPAFRELGIEAVPAVWDSRVDWRRFDAVLIRATWDYVLKYERYLAWLDELEASGARVLNPVPLIRWNLDKTYLRELESRGVAVPPTLWVEAGSPEQALEEARRRGWRDLVLKPAVSADALHTYRMPAEEPDAFAPVFRKLARRPPFLIQPFLPGISAPGEWSLIFFQGRFSHAVLKTPKPGDFRSQRNHGGQARAAEAPAGLIDQAAAILRHSPLPALYARVDLIPHAGAFVLGELELAEPSLFLDCDGKAPARLARAVAEELSSGDRR